MAFNICSLTWPLVSNRLYKDIFTRIGPANSHNQRTSNRKLKQTRKLSQLRPCPRLFSLCFLFPCLSFSVCTGLSHFPGFISSPPESLADRIRIYFIFFNLLHIDHEFLNITPFIGYEMNTVVFFIQKKCSSLIYMHLLSA